MALIAETLGTSADYLLGLTDDPSASVVREKAAVWFDGPDDDLTPDEVAELQKYKEWLKARRKPGEGK